MLLRLPPAKKPARARIQNIRAGTLEVEGVKIPLNSSEVRGVTENLPPKKEGVMLIVSLLVCRANPGRDDLLVVDELVRDEEGRVVGAKALSLNPYFKGGVQAPEIGDFELHYVDDFNDQLELGVGVKGGKGYILASNDMGYWEFPIPPELALALARHIKRTAKKHRPYKDSLD